MPLINSERLKTLSRFNGGGIGIFLSQEVRLEPLPVALHLNDPTAGRWVPRDVSIARRTSAPRPRILSVPSAVTWSKVGSSVVEFVSVDMIDKDSPQWPQSHQFTVKKYRPDGISSSINTGSVPPCITVPTPLTDESSVRCINQHVGDSLTRAIYQRKTSRGRVDMLNDRGSSSPQIGAESRAEHCASGVDGSCLAEELHTAAFAHTAYWRNTPSNVGTLPSAVPTAALSDIRRLGQKGAAACLAVTRDGTIRGHSEPPIRGATPRPSESRRGASCCENYTISAQLRALGVIA